MKEGYHMYYINHYASPLGGITMASNGKKLTGLWFDQQKYFSCITFSKLIPTKNFKLKTARNRIKSNKIGS